MNFTPICSERLIESDRKEIMRSMIRLVIVGVAIGLAARAQAAVLQLGGSPEYNSTTGTDLPNAYVPVLQVRA
jgi:hypothetical protein